MEVVAFLSERNTPLSVPRWGGKTDFFCGEIQNTSKKTFLLMQSFIVAHRQADWTVKKCVCLPSRTRNSNACWLNVISMCRYRWELKEDRRKIGQMCGVHTQSLENVVSTVCVLKYTWEYCALRSSKVFLFPACFFFLSPYKHLLFLSQNWEILEY